MLEKPKQPIQRGGNFSLTEPIPDFDYNTNFLSKRDFFRKMEWKQMSVYRAMLNKDPSSKNYMKLEKKLFSFSRIFHQVFTVSNNNNNIFLTGGIKAKTNDVISDFYELNI